MSLVNLSLTGNPAVCSVVNDAFATAFSKKLSYFGGMIGCLYVVVGVIYFGAMSAIDLLAKNENDNKEQMKILHRLMEQQQEKMASLEKELETQKQNSQILYTTLAFTLNESEKKIRVHQKLIVQHTNEIYGNIDAINRHTDILDNHQETLTNLVRYLHEQNKAINNTHREVENQKSLIQSQMDTIDGVVEDLEHLTEEFDRITEQTDQSFCEMEIKLEDAIENFQETKERLTDRLEEHELLLSSVDVAFDRMDEIEDLVEDYVAELKDGMKEMGDRVEEVDREVLAVVKSTEKMELDLGTLYDDFIGTADMVDTLFVCPDNLDA